MQYSNALAWLVVLLAVPAATAAEPTQALQSVEISGESTAAREQLTLDHLLAIQRAFTVHQALAPQAELRIRLYPRRDGDDLKALDLELRYDDRRMPVTLDEQQRFAIDPAWQALPTNTVLRSRLPQGRLAWHPDIRTPGLPPDTRRLGDLRLECQLDVLGHRSLQRFVKTPGYFLLAATVDVCAHFKAYPHFADRPIFGLTLKHGSRVRQLPYEHLHGSWLGQSHPLFGLVDWAYWLRDRMFWVPLGDKSWPDDTLVLLEPMDDGDTPGLSGDTLSESATARRMPLLN